MSITNLYAECTDIMESRLKHLRERDWINVQDTVRRAAFDGNDSCKVILASGVDEMEWLEHMLGPNYKVFKSKCEIEAKNVCTILWKHFLN